MCVCVKCVVSKKWPQKQMCVWNAWCVCRQFSDFLPGPHFAVYWHAGPQIWTLDSLRTCPGPKKWTTNMCVWNVWCVCGQFSDAVRVLSSFTTCSGRKSVLRRVCVFSCVLEQFYDLLRSGTMFKQKNRARVYASVYLSSFKTCSGHTTIHKSSKNP